MSHPACSGGLPPLSLDTPAELADLGSGVATGGTNLFLDVECNLTTSNNKIGLMSN